MSTCFSSRDSFFHTKATSVLDGESRLVECFSGNGEVAIRVAGREFRVMLDAQKGGQPQVLLHDRVYRDQLEKEVLLGPVLVMALALRGTFCFHASAVLPGGRAIAFLGDSGFGKSTLAAYLSRDPAALQQPGPEMKPSSSPLATEVKTEAATMWRRVADDILPVRLGSPGVNAWPHFPQLKIPPSSQPSIGLPEEIPLSAICLLNVVDQQCQPALSLLTPAQALPALLRHTAGSRLFDPGLLASHLEFCAEVTARIPLYELCYPHRRDALPLVMSCIAQLP